MRVEPKHLPNIIALGFNFLYTNLKDYIQTTVSIFKMKAPRKKYKKNIRMAVIRIFGRQRQEDRKYKAGTCSTIAKGKKKNLGMLSHACNPSTRETEAGKLSSMMPA